MLVANLQALASSIVLMTWTKPWLFEPILVFLESAQFSWTSPFSASLKRLALSLVIGPLENDKGSCANSAQFPLVWSACPAPWCASPPSKNIKPWTTRSSLNIKPSKSRASLGRAGHSSVWPRSFSLWSNGFFLSLIWWVIFFYFLFLFFNLDFRWLLGVDLVECFVLADLCLCFVLAEILSFQFEWTNRVFECWYINRVSNSIRIWKPTLKDSIYSPKLSLLALRCY